MTRYVRYVLGIAIGAAAIVASAMAFAQPMQKYDRGNRGGAAAPAYRQAQPGPRYAAPQYQRPAFQRPAYRQPAPQFHRPAAPAYRPAPQVYQRQVYQRPAIVNRAYNTPHWRPRPVYRAPVYQPYPVYQAYPVYPAAPVYQEWPGEAGYGCVWKKRKVWTLSGLRIKWKRICY